MATNQSWNLESFLDSLIVELDKARETLAVKAINKPLTYAVKDVNLEMQLFPRFDGKKVQFVTAEPGQTGASKIVIQLGSITDQQVRKTTKNPISKDDVSLEVIEEIDDDTKDSLRKIGVTSVNDLAEIEKKNVDLEKVSKKKVSYKKLANLLQKSRRGNFPPTVNRASFSLAQTEEHPVLTVEGMNLAIDRNYEPIAVWNGELTDILTSGSSVLSLKIDSNKVKDADNELIMILDPFTVFKMKINNPK
ncbi:MAG: hypothetical protein AAF806_07715 [Bacteroidota bacterium]